MVQNLFAKIGNSLDFGALFAISPVGFALNRLSSGEFLQGNQALLDLIGYAPEEFARLTYWDITPPRYAEQEKQALEQLRTKGEYGPYYKEYIHKNGRLVPVMLRGVKTADAHGEEYFFSVVSDLTERVLAEEQINKLLAAVEQAPSAVFIANLEGKIEYANRKFEELNGFTREDYMGKTPALLQSGEMSPEFYRELWDNLANGREWTFEICNRRKDGTLYWLREHISYVRDKLGRITHYLSIAQDITEVRRQEIALQHQARYDQLTGIGNRFQGIEHLRESIARSLAAGRLTVLLFIDLDNFKYINDTLGHRTGDLILIEAAARLRMLLKEEDTLARFGGDEFLVIIDGVHNVAEAEARIRDIYRQFATSFTIDGVGIHVTISGGVTIAPHNGTDPDELIRFADSAMYEAKERGRNTFHFFDARLSDSTKNRFNLERELRTALEEQQLSVYFQPFIDLASGEVVGAEALVRWQNPRLGAVSPVEFIPIAEQTGLIEDIGRFVLESAIIQTERWQDLISPRFQMSVNVSPRQFRQGRIVADLKDLLSRHALDARRIKLEVTEGLLLQPHHNPVETLNEIKAMGVGVAMDDFGTGYSSLLNLRQFSFDLLKIDRSFIQDLGENSQTRAMVNAIIAMCKSLDLHVIAEGIETIAQRDYLLQQGCALGQGYLFAKPVRAAEFQRLLLARTLPA